MPLDYAAIMGASQNLVPNLAQRALVQQQVDQQGVEIQAQAAAQNQKIERQHAFQGDLDKALLDGRPQAIQQLMIRYPEFSEGIKPAWQAMDAEQKRIDLTQSGTVFARAQAGDYKGAADVLRQRVEADTAAGKGDPTDQAILAGLESGDPTQQKAAMATIGIHLAAIEPDKFAETYGKLNPDDKVSPFMREYQDRVTQFGKKAADEWAQTQDTKLVPVQQGGTVYAYGPTAGTTPAQPGGGDQSTSAGLSMPVERGSFGNPDQQFGATRPGHVHNGLDIAAPAGSPVRPVAPGKVVAVGDQGRDSGGLFVKVKHADGTISSYAHLGSQAVKVGQDVDASTELGTVGTSGNATGPVVHLVIRKNGRAVDPRPLLTGAAVVRTKQQYDALPSGANYIAPDGSHRVKS